MQLIGVIELPSVVLYEFSLIHCKSELSRTIVCVEAKHVTLLRAKTEFGIFLDRLIHLTQTLLHLAAALFTSGRLKYSSTVYTMISF